MTGRVLAVVHLGRPQGRGEVARVASWRAIAAAAGLSVVEIPLLAPDGRPHPAGARPRDAVDLAAGRVVPESLAWSTAAATAKARETAPAAVVAVTARAFTPALVGVAPVTILDLVDRLSHSYRDRAAITTSRSGALGFSALGRAHARFERHLPAGVVLVAAGWSDAQELGAAFVPNVLAVEAPLPGRSPDHDVLFFGTLDYPPNVAGLRTLAGAWEAVLAQRPGTKLLVAGARPSAEVVALAAHHGWTLLGEYRDVSALAGRARIAVAPLPYASGIQNKVLEAAALGLPQVVSPAVAAGLPPDFPVRVADERELASAVVALVAQGSDQGAAGREYVAARFSPQGWSGWLLSSVGSATR
ncbi:MAG TPA: glycosyltransferase family 4 protein [Acidimicrobiales bacterium]|nr:glycosyltransferase family 4 protein [Acidimicrobiales bacterium]